MFYKQSLGLFNLKNNYGKTISSLFLNLQYIISIYSNVITEREGTVDF